MVRKKRVKKWIWEPYLCKSFQKIKNSWLLEMEIVQEDLRVNHLKITYQLKRWPKISQLSIKRIK